MKSKYNHFVSLPFILLFLFFAALAHSVIILQLPGVSIGSNDAPTVDIDFLDDHDAVLYTLKGEILTKTFPEQSQSAFYPDKLTGSVKFIKKVRIKAAESGLLLRLFDDPTATLPNLFVQMKTSFAMDKNKPIDIDVVDSPDFDPYSSIFLHNWLKRDKDEMRRQRGFHIAKIEVFVQRKEQPPLQPVFKFGVIAAPQNNVLMPNNLVSGVQGVSLIPSPNAAYLGPSQSSPNVYLNMAAPPTPPMLVTQPQIQQFPNAPAFLAPS